MMNLDLYFEILKVAISAAVGSVVTKKMEKRPRLISYILHPTTVELSIGDEKNPLRLHTHALCIENLGRAAAKNVTLIHYILPDFGVWPPTRFTTEELPGGAKCVCFEFIEPNSRITLQYIYSPPITFDKVHILEKAEHGVVRRIQVWTVQYFGEWFNRFAGLVLLVGVVTIIYFLFTVVVWILTKVNS